MNDSFRHTRSKRNVVRPMVLALALALPLSAAVAVQMGDVVTTRADQNIDEQYGRDSVYALSPGKQSMPGQTSSVDRLASQNAPTFNASSDSELLAGSGYVASSDSATPIGSGYVGSEEPQGNITGNSLEQSAADDSQEAVDSQYLVFTPLATAMSLPAAATEEEATSEFVIIVPDNSADESASSDEENSLAVD